MQSINRAPLFRWIFAPTLLLTLLVSGPLAAQEPPEQDEQEQALCQEIDAIQVDEQTIRACADGRVLIEDGEEQDILFATGDLEGLIQRDGYVWIITRQKVATPLESLAQAPTLATRPRERVRPQQPQPRDPAPEVEPEPETEPEPAPAAEPDPRPISIAEIAEYDLGRIIIDIGAEEGISVGDPIEFFVEHTAELGPSETSTTEETVAVAPVSSVSESRAEVVLGLNERVPSGARARITSQDITARSYVPPRLGSLTRIGFTLRPFLALNTLGAGTLSDAYIAHHFQGPWALKAILDPLAIGFGNEGTFAAFTGTGMLSYDITPFQVGLGIGGTTINTTASQFREDFPGTDPEVEPEPADFALAISQKIRLGSLDGIHAQVMNSFFYAVEGFRYGGTTVQVQLPLIGFGDIGEHSWLVARGGGNYAGSSFGEIGLRVLVRGNGDHDSLYFTPTVGGSQLRSGERRDRGEFISGQEIRYGGPMIGFQVEWRP